MSESWTKYFMDQVDKFLKETGYYPEKIIMPENDFKQLALDRNKEVFFSGELFPVDSKFYKNIKIEIDKEINDWILVAPDNNGYIFWCDLS